MISKWAIFFARIASSARLKDKGIFAVYYLLPLLPRLLFALKIQVLTFGQTADSFTFGTFGLIEL